MKLKFHAKFTLHFYTEEEMNFRVSTSRILDKIGDFWNTIRRSFFYLLSSIRPQVFEIKARKLKVLKKLGEGGYSFVYLVEDKLDLTKYALKQINCPLSDQVKLVRQEIASHGLVKSPNVLELIDYKFINSPEGIKGAYLLLPYHPNGTIQDLIERSISGIPIERIAQYGIDICNALMAFHTLNPPRAFRDLKPANILISNNQSAILMDLGSVSVARVVISSRNESIILQDYCAETVTAPYRPPELFDPPSSCTITESTDIWYFASNKVSWLCTICDGVW
jgi:serine/threonine kinase 16